MKIQLLFPIVLIILDLGASVVYLWKGDIKHSIYWLSASVLTICVTI